MIEDQGEVALTFLYENGKLVIESYVEPETKKNFSKTEKKDLFLAAMAIHEDMESTTRTQINTYLSSVFAQDSESPKDPTDTRVGAVGPSNQYFSQVTSDKSPSVLPVPDYGKETPRWNQEKERQSNTSDKGNSIPVKETFPVKKYKPVALKVKPILGELPQKFRIEREIKGDPLAAMPKLSTNPKPFVPTGRYTEERKAIIDKLLAKHPDFLTEQETLLVHDFMMKHEKNFAWEDSE